MIDGVRVVSTGGLFSITDSLGRYSLPVNDKDSVTFIYSNKTTQKFIVKDIPDPAHFNISLHVRVKGKYTLLKEVVVRTRSYRQDSLENRMDYADIFNFQKPGLSTSILPGGGVGANLDELINIFRFKRNKRLKAFQTRLEQQEEEKYVNYRFSKYVVRRITQLQGADLDNFMILYRPSYEFVVAASEQEFDQYLLNCSYSYKHAAGALNKQ